MKARENSSHNGSSISQIAVGILSVGALVLLLVYAQLLWDSTARLGIIFLSIGMAISALNLAKENKLIPLSTKWNTWVAIGIIIAAAILAIYFYHELPALFYERAGNNTTTDFVLGGMAMFLVVFLSWGQMGIAIPLLCVVSLLYAFFGNYVPGFLSHPDLSWQRVLQMSAVQMTGVYGQYPALMVRLVMIFLIYAGLVQGFGGLNYIIGVTRLITGRFKYGLPQIAVISSMAFGSFSGSGAANVAGTGSFTIPMMKRGGIPPSIAGGIESVASSGGQVMPPIMGITAFLMSDFLDVPYVRIMAIGLVPALIFYACTAFAIHLHARRHLITAPTSKESQPDEKPKFGEGLPIFVSLAVLLLMLIHFRLSVLVSGYYTVVSFVIVRLLYDLVLSRNLPTRRIYSVMVDFGRNLLAGAKQGASTMASLIVLISTIGIVVKVIVTTGLAQRLAFGMVDIAGGHLLLLLLLILLISVLFGMAVATLVSYILVVILAAPALQQFGIEPINTHFTVFYLSVTAGLTPPVALCCIVASSISGAPFLSTCRQSMRIGIVFFLLPFIFIWHPGLLSFSSETPIIASKLLIGLMAIVYSLNSQSAGATGYLQRIVLFCLGGIGIFYPVEYIRFLCLGAIALLFLASLVWKRSKLHPNRLMFV